MPILFGLPCLRETDDGPKHEPGSASMAHLEMARPLRCHAQCSVRPVECFWSQTVERGPSRLASFVTRLALFLRLGCSKLPPTTSCLALFGVSQLSRCIILNPVGPIQDDHLSKSSTSNSSTPIHYGPTAQSIRALCFGPRKLPLPKAVGF